MLKWIPALGILAGFLLSVAAGMLPAHLQTASLCLGPVVMLVAIAAAVAPLAKESNLAWRGVSPVAGILVGFLVFMVPAGRQYFANRPEEPSSNAASGAHSAMPRTAPARITPAPRLTSAQEVRDPGPQPGAPSLDRVLLGVRALLNQKARPAIQATQSAFVTTGRKSGPASPESEASEIRARLQTATAGVTDLERSLAQIKSENPSFSAQLDTIFGDTTLLTELSSGLQQYGDSLQYAAASGEVPAAPVQVRMDADKANRWIGECELRLGELSASAETSVARR